MNDIKLEEPNYLYEGHLGGLFYDNEKLEYEELYCEQCGDSDWYIGKFQTLQECYDLLFYNDNIGIFGLNDYLCGFELKYICLNIFNQIFKIPEFANYTEDSEISDEELINILSKYIELHKEDAEKKLEEERLLEEKFNNYKKEAEDKIIAGKKKGT